MSRNDIYKRERQGDLELRILYDQNPESPREWDNVSQLVCWNSRYSLGDKHDYTSPRDIEIPDYVELRREFTAKERKKYGLDYPGKGAASQDWAEFGTALCIARIERDLDSVYRLPLNLYDHSGITISTGSFSCPWDSGQVGWVFAPRKRIRACFGWTKMTPARLERVKEALEQDVETYDQYLRGDVYGYEAVKYKKCGGCGHEEAEHVDSCRGFLGELNRARLAEM